MIDTSRESRGEGVASQSPEPASARSSWLTAGLTRGSRAQSRCSHAGEATQSRELSCVLPSPCTPNPSAVSLLAAARSQLSGKLGITACGVGGEEGQPQRQGEQSRVGDESEGTLRSQFS